MAIDYGIVHPCVPRETLETDGILERLKGRERARAIIGLFRENGDQRPPSEMGFEFTRSTPAGAEETRVIVVQDMLDQAAALDPLERHCAGCPANLTGAPFGCFGRIDYPVSSAAERWLLDQLPGIEQPLVWLLLRQGVQEMGYDGAAVRALRANPAYFEERRVMGRDMAEFVISADQVFEMLFLLGALQPAHAGVLLLFFNVIRRDLEAGEIQRIMRAGGATIDAMEIAARYPCLLREDDNDDRSLAQFKAFFRALHTAWRLNVPLMVDA